MLGEALRNIDGPSDIPPWRRRTILTGLAKLSPRSESPTSRLTADGIFDEIRECEVTSREHYHGSGGEVAAMASAAGSVDEVDGDEIYEEDPVYGPRTRDESNLDDSHRMRRNALNELYGRLAQAHQTRWCISAYCTYRISDRLVEQLHLSNIVRVALMFHRCLQWCSDLYDDECIAPFAAFGYLH